MPENKTTPLDAAAIRAVLASNARQLRIMAFDVDDPQFEGNSLTASRVVGTLRRIAADMDELRNDVLALAERKTP